MKFYFEIEFTDKTKIGGHNCEGFYIKNGNLVLLCYDEIRDYENDIIEIYYTFSYELSKIKSFKIDKMEE